MDISQILLTDDIISKLTTPDKSVQDSNLHSELLTEGIGTLSGKGAFDELMKAVDEHLTREYKAQRITGSMYSTLYAQALTAAMQTASQYAIQGSSAYWQAKIAEASYRKAEAEILKALADIEYARLQTEIAKKDLELKEKELTLKEKEIDNMKYQAWSSLQRVLTEQAETQDKIGKINPNNVGDPVSIFTPTVDVAGSSGAAKAFQNKQTSELERTAVRSLAEHYKSTFDTNQTSLSDLKPYAFGYNGSRVKAVENLLLSKFGLDGPAIDQQHPESSESDRETE